MDMSNKYLKLYSADESKAIDALAIEKLSLAPLDLMSRAAKFAFNTMPVSYTHLTLPTNREV